MKRLLTAVAAAGLSFGAFAADEQDYTQWVTLTNSDSASSPRVNSFAYHSSSITNYWSDGCYPSKDKSYYVPAGKQLMTTTSSKNASKFAGDRLHVAGGVYQRGTTGSGLSLGSDGVLLSGGYIRFAATDSYLYGAVGILATEDDPAMLQLNPSFKTDRGRLSFEGTITGGSGTAFKLVRTSANYYLTAPDSTFLAEESSFANYFGTLILSNHVELAFLTSVADPVVPGTLRIENKSRLFSDGEGQAITVGTLEIANGAMMKWSFMKSGVARPVVVTNALVFADDAKLKVQFAEWYPHPGAQKYPILKLTGAAADSAVTADDFILDITSPMWRNLPKTNNPRIAIDETADGKVISVEWPDEPEPFTYPDEDGNLVLDVDTQYGNVIDDLSDGDTPLSVIKKGEGTVRIGPNSPFTGTLDVREGKLIVGNPCWEYYRWVIQQTFNTTSAGESQNTSTRTVGIRKFGLFDANGSDRTENFTDVGDWSVNSHYYRSLTYGTPIEPGHFRWTEYNGKAAITLRGFNAKDSSESLATNLFVHSDYGVLGMNGETHQKHATYEITNTWQVLTMRLPVGAPVTSWDYLDVHNGNNNQMISNCLLEASLDCKNWTVLDTIVQATKPTHNTWHGDGTAYEANYTTHTGGMAIDPWPMDPISFAASKVSVAEGATLEAHTGVAPVISDLRIDHEKGLGTIKGFAFAETGTLRIENTYGLRNIRIAADLSGVAGYGNLANWTVVIDGKDVTGKRVVTVTAEGIAIQPHGFLILIGATGGGRVSQFVSPAEGETVPLLSERQKAFLRMSPPEVATAISNEVDELVASDDLLKKVGTGPLAVDFRWRPGLGKVLLTVAKKGAETTPFFHDYVTEGSVSLKNLEVGAHYLATLKGKTVDETIEFGTEDLAPRCIALTGRSNTRDMGGRVMMNGRRVRQGLMYRTGQFEKDGTMAISEETRRYIVETLGIRTDIDLRADDAVASIVANGGVSPLGSTVRWIHEWDNYHDYSSVHTTGADATKRIFRYMMDPANYPMVFHCAGGADRTGTLATLVHGVLGASDDEIWMDYYITSWGGAINQKRYPAWISSLIHSFDKFEGATISDRICAYFRETLGFTDEDLDRIRDIMLEPAD